MNNRCWAQLPEDRPTFPAVIEEIQKITQQLIAEYLEESERRREEERGGREEGE